MKTDRRDARKLAELLRAGLLPEVRPPTPAEEAVHDVCRARDDARDDLQRARHRLGKLLLRRALHFSGGKNWTKAHRRWITRRVVFLELLALLVGGFSVVRGVNWDASEMVAERGLQDYRIACVGWGQSMPFNGRDFPEAWMPMDRCGWNSDREEAPVLLCACD